MSLLRAAQGLSHSASPLYIALQRLHEPSARGFASASDASANAESAYTGPPKLVVLGGRGFVGSAICQQALKTGLQVVSISPSGTPPPGSGAWAKEVEWVRGNALEPMTYQHVLPGAMAAISCIGAFGSQAHMLKINGTANTVAVAAARAAGIPRYVYISATLPPLPGLDLIADGYVKGKRQAEEAVLQEYPTSGVILRPYVIYGDRAVSTNLTLPLGLLFKPVEQLMGHVPNRKQLASMPVVGAALLKSTSVKAVARAAVEAATDDLVPAGIMDCWQIAEKYEL